VLSIVLVLLINRNERIEFISQNNIYVKVVVELNINRRNRIDFRMLILTIEVTALRLIYIKRI